MLPPHPPALRAGASLSRKGRGNVTVRFMRFFVCLAALIGVLHVGMASATDTAESETREFEHLASAALGRDLTYSVYLPPGFANGTLRYPVAYLLHGVDGNHLEYLHDGNLRGVLDALIAERRAPPMIVVMPQGDTSWYVDSQAVGGPGDYATAIGEELPRAVETRLRGLPEREGRAIGGFSMGGFGALCLAFAQPFRYAAAASLSGAFWTRVTPTTVMADWTDRIFQGSFGHPFDAARFVRSNPFWMSESLRGAAQAPAVFLASGDADRFRAYVATAELDEKLRAAGVAVQLRSYKGDHDWGTWGTALPDLLEFFGKALEPPR
jgi:S-formylglutathione hydrolase FrmB